jgi:hypothetical protein
MQKFIKTKQGQSLGFRTPDHFKRKTFVSQAVPQKFNPARFRTQHKG